MPPTAKFILNVKFVKNSINYIMSMNLSDFLFVVIKGVKPVNITPRLMTTASMTLTQHLLDP